MALCHVLVLSRFTPVEPWARVPAVFRRARARAATLGVNGAMLFDGERVMQWAEGAPEAVHGWLGLVRGDDEHLDVDPIHTRPHEGSRELTKWVAGFADPSQIDDVLAALAGGHDPLPVLRQMLALADVD